MTLTVLLSVDLWECAGGRTYGADSHDCGVISQLRLACTALVCVLGFALIHSVQSGYICVSGESIYPL